MRVNKFFPITRQVLCHASYLQKSVCGEGVRHGVNSTRILYQVIRGSGNCSENMFKQQSMFILSSPLEWKEVVTSVNIQRRFRLYGLDLIFMHVFIFFSLHSLCMGSSWTSALVCFRCAPWMRVLLHPGLFSLPWKCHNVLSIKDSFWQVMWDDLKCKLSVQLKRH